MGTYSELESDSPDTDARIDAKAPTADRSTHTAKPGALIPADSSNGSSDPLRLFGSEAEAYGDNLGDVVAAVTTITQPWCEHGANYADIETLVCRLPIDQWTFAPHDALAPYSGPYSMTLLIRAFLIKGVNGWDETALYDYLRAHPSLRRGLGFETVPNQSTF